METQIQAQAPVLPGNGDSSINIDDVLGTVGRVKVLGLLARRGEVNITELVAKTELYHANIVVHLRFLVGIDFVQEKRFGRIRIYRLKVENRKAKALQSLIKFWENSFADLPAPQF